MNEIPRIGALTPQDLMALGLEQIAYVKPVQVEGKTAYAIHAADGTQVAVMSNRDHAIATVRQHDLEPLSVH